MKAMKSILASMFACRGGSKVEVSGETETPPALEIKPAEMSVPIRNNDANHSSDIKVKVQYRLSIFDFTISSNASFGKFSNLWRMYLVNIDLWAIII